VLRISFIICSAWPAIAYCKWIFIITHIIDYNKINTTKMYVTKKRTSIIDKELTPSRKIDESELLTLRTLLQDVLNIHPFNDTDHEDAEILLD